MTFNPELGVNNCLRKNVRGKIKANATGGGVSNKHRRKKKQVESSSKKKTNIA